MKYVKIKHLNNIDVQLIMENIFFREYILQLLYLTIPTVDDKMIQNLNQIICSRKIVMDYSIKRVADQIYFTWKY